MSELEVALAKELCPCCLKEIDGPIIMNTLLTKNEAAKVKELHGKVIGYSPGLCAECKEKYASKGFIIIEIDEKKGSPDNPYRTGFMCVIKTEAAERIFKELFNKPLPDRGIAFISSPILIQLGLHDYGNKG